MCSSDGHYEISKPHRMEPLVFKRGSNKAGGGKGCEIPILPEQFQVLVAHFSERIARHDDIELKANPGFLRIY